MQTEIMVALITLAGSALGTFGGIFLNSRMTAYRVEQLEKKVDKHNSLIERTFRLEVQSQQTERRIENLEEKVL